MSTNSKKHHDTKSPRGDALTELDNFEDEFRDEETGDREIKKLRDRLRRAQQDYSVVESLLDVSSSVTSTLNLNELLENIVDSILRLTECQRGFLMLKKPDGSLSLEIARVKGQNEWKETELDISKTIVGEVVASKKPIFSSDVHKMKNVKISDSIHLLKINTVICLPLEGDRDLVGVIYADSKFISERILETDIKVMRAFASLAAVAINNARRHGELRSQREKLEEQNISLRHKLGEEFARHGMVSHDKKMEEIFEAVDKIAPSNISVLIQGESGTGKELLARAIHEKSLRKSERFEPVNCAAIPPGLVESTLFGHVRGAFTDAKEDRAGVFELAHKGTLFLDEIGDMPTAAQAKILRVIQDGEVKRIGEENGRKVDVRIIVASNVDLAKAVSEDTFRPDLYFRLKVAQIDLPPLRERRGDILPLAESFLKRHAEESGEPVPTLDNEAKKLLYENNWVGNIRVLKSCIEWAIVFKDQENKIRGNVLKKFFKEGEDVMESDSNDSLKARLQRYEEKVIRQNLSKHSWNVTTTAKALDISRQQLHNKIKKFNINSKGE